MFPVMVGQVANIDIAKHNILVEETKSIFITCMILKKVILSAIKFHLSITNRKYNKIYLIQSCVNVALLSRILSPRFLRCFRRIPSGVFFDGLNHRLLALGLAGGVEYRKIVLV